MALMPLRFSEILLLPNSALVFRCNLKLVLQTRFGSFGLLTPRFNLYSYIYKKLYRPRGSHTSLPAPKSQRSVKKAQRSIRSSPANFCHRQYSSNMQAISAARSVVLSNLNHTADSYFCLSKLSYIAWLYLSDLNESCGISRAVHFINILFSSITQLSFPRPVPPLRSTPVTRSRPSLSWTL